MITDPKTVPAGQRRPHRLRGAGGDHQRAADGAPDRRVRHQGRPPGGLVVVCAVAPGAGPIPPGRAHGRGRPRALRGAMQRRPARRDGAGEPGSGRGGGGRAGGGRHRGGRDSGARDRGAGSRGGPERPAGGSIPTTLPRSPSTRRSWTTTTSSPGPGMQAVVVSLAQNLDLENQALLERDASLLTAVDHGDRLEEMRGRLDGATASGVTTIAHYDFDAIDVSLLVPFGAADRPQPGPARAWNRHRGALRGRRHASGSPLVAVRPDVRHAPGHGRPLDASWPSCRRPSERAAGPAPPGAGRDRRLRRRRSPLVSARPGGDGRSRRAGGRL